MRNLRFRKRIRPKNFRVRVFRNGDNTLCAYCASCSMSIVSLSFANIRIILFIQIFADATSKLRLIRPAKRLFDYDGYEIFQSEDIQRDMEYFVSSGEDFIDPLDAIEGKTFSMEHFFHKLSHFIIFDK